MTRRRKSSIRIREPRDYRRAAWATLLIGVVVVGVVIAVWRVWRSEEVPLARQRSLFDVELRWRCGNGHSFRAPGQMDPYVCPRCGAPAEAVDSYLCPQHGRVEVQIRFAPHPVSGQPVASQWRIGHGGVWQPLAAGVRCPRCGQPMKRERLDYRDRVRERGP